MIFDLIGTLSLLWVSVTFCLTEANREILDLFNRLKFNLSADEKGSIEKSELTILQSIGINEVIDLLPTITGKTPYHLRRRRVIEKFKSKYEWIQKLKFLLMSNLLILSFAVLIFIILEYYPGKIFKIYFVISFVFNMFFYWEVNKIQNLKLSKIEQRR